MTTAVEEVRIPAPELRGPMLELAAYPDLELGVDGPAGTGKTFGILYFIHILLLTYPGAKWLVARKHNTDLAGSAMATYRESVLDPREGVNYFGGNKVRPAAYEYPNGSVLIVNGLDKPGKVRSMDFDGIYINEATECEIDDIEFCHMRLARRGKSAIPERFQKLLMDFNPDHPRHFLNMRMHDGLTRRLLSRHEDNPFLWDATTNDWTEAGRRYIGVLDSLTGVRLARYRYGLWAASEGTVYEDSWDRARNLINPFPIPAEWPRYLAVDFGFTNPFVCLWAAQDPDGRLFVYRQIYKTKTLVEDHAKVIRSLSRWGQPGGDPLPRAIICDHDAEDRATLERHLGLRTLPAQKNVSAGIQAVASRFKAAGDNRPRVMILRDSLAERDMELAAKKAPSCLEDEPESYVWDTRQGMKHGEAPVKEHDHGCLIAGTLITTARGDVPIEQIQSGDYALTRNGYKQVKAAGLTARNAEVYTITFSNGATLTGTGNHPVFHNKHGYIPLRSLRYGDIIQDINHYKERYPQWAEIKENQKSSTTRESRSGAIPSPLSSVFATTIAQMPAIGEQAFYVFIRKYGETRTALSQAVTRYITRMRTRLTTPLITWNASRKRNTRNGMNFTKSPRVASSYENTLHQRYRKLQRRGTLQRKGKRGIESWDILHGKAQSTERMYASNVETNSNHVICVTIGRVSAPTIVSQHIDARYKQTLYLQSANNAEKNLPTTNTIRCLALVRRHVRQNYAILARGTRSCNVQFVTSNSARLNHCIENAAQKDAQTPYVVFVEKECARKDVYNLTVENAVGEGEYFANGVLVHNCDALRYLIAYFDLIPSTVAYSNRIY